MSGLLSGGSGGGLLSGDSAGGLLSGGSGGGLLSGGSMGGMLAGGGSQGLAGKVQCALTMLSLPNIPNLFVVRTLSFLHFLNIKICVKLFLGGSKVLWAFEVKAKIGELLFGAHILIKQNIIETTSLVKQLLHCRCCRARSVTHGIK